MSTQALAAGMDTQTAVAMWTLAAGTGTLTEAAMRTLGSGGQTPAMRTGGRWTAVGRCRMAVLLLLSARRLGPPTMHPFDDFVLGLAARGVGRHLALGAFAASFLASDEVDVLWRLREGILAADAQLGGAGDGRASDERASDERASGEWASGPRALGERASEERASEERATDERVTDERATGGRGLTASLTVLFVAGEGTAYGVAVGEAPLRVDGVQVLGREDGAALGAGEMRSGGIEQWWPNMADGSGMRLAPGALLGLGTGDDGPGVEVRFGGGQVATPRIVARAGWLVTVAGGGVGLACLVEDDGLASVAGLLGDALANGFTLGAGTPGRVAAVACGMDGGTETVALGGASVTPAGAGSQDGLGRGHDGLGRNEDRVGWGQDGLGRGNEGLGRSQDGVGRGQDGLGQGEGGLGRGNEGRAFVLRLGSDPLDRGVLIGFEVAAGGSVNEGRETPGLARWVWSLATGAGGGWRRRRRT